jgi:hypothetical protein
MNLTVAIPTYNRNETLLEHLSHLLPQLEGRARLLILDNASPQPVAETLAPLLAKYPRADCRIVRHAANVGGNANILRCIELCETEWVWLLGDDDIAKPDAIATIRRHCAEYPNALFINFYSAAEPYVRRETVVAHGLANLVEKIDRFGNVLFLSCGVYRAPALRGQLKIGSHYVYSCAPHVVLVLASAGDDGECVMSADEVVSWGGPPPVSQQFPNVSVLLGMGTLLELPMPTRVRHQLAERMLDTIRSWVPIRALFSQLLIATCRGGDGAEARFIYGQVRRRLYSLDANPLRRLEMLVYGMLLHVPRLSFILLSVPYRVARGRAFGSLEAQSRWGRV